MRSLNTGDANTKAAFHTPVETLGWHFVRF